MAKPPCHSPHSHSGCSTFISILSGTSHRTSTFAITSFRFSQTRRYEINMPDNRGPQVAGVAGFFVALTTIIVCLRCYCRIAIVKNFGLDDYLSVLAQVSMLSVYHNGNIELTPLDPLYLLLHICDYGCSLWDRSTCRGYSTSYEYPDWP